MPPRMPLSDRRLHGERGATAVEYALYVALVAIGLFLGVTFVMTALGTTLTGVASDPIISGDGSGSITVPAPAPSATPTPSATPAPSATPTPTPTPTPSQEAPGAPRAVSVEMTGRGQVSASWSAPTSGGSPSAYRAQWERVDRDESCDAGAFTSPDYSWTGSASSAAKSDLDDESWYCVRVLAKNTSEGPWAYAGPVLAGPTPPEAPSNVQAVSRASKQITVTWSAPAGSDLGYDVEWEKVDSSSTACADDEFGDPDDSWAGTATTATQGGLSTSSWYCVRVRADQDGSTSRWVYAGPITAAPVVTVPGAPRNLIADGENKNSIDLDWDAPSSNGGAAVSDYVIEVRKSGTAAWTVVNDGRSSTTSRVVSDLTKGTRYEFRVAAVNEAGQGPYSELLTHSTDS